MYIYYGFIVDQGRSSIYGFIEPQTIQPLETHMTTSNFICKHGWLSQIERSTLRHTLMRMCFC